MSGYINRSGNYEAEEFGIIHVNVRYDARTIRAHWKGGMLHVAAPTGVSYDVLMHALRSFGPKLQQTKPKSLYYDGQRIEMPEFFVELGVQVYKPQHVILTPVDGGYRVNVGSDFNFDDPSTHKTVSSMLCRIAAFEAPRILLPRAKEIAARIGKSPIGWSISRGHRVLGHCSARGIVSLSCVLVYYPQQLRDFVMCHELAHLSEMNHSARFHAICDKYCDGREQELVAALRAFRAPVV